MRCDDAQQALALKGTAREHRSGVKAHVATCVTCRRFVAWSITIDTVAGNAPKWEPPPAFARRTAARILDDPSVDAVLRSSPHDPRISFSALASIVRGVWEHGLYAAAGVAWMLRQYWTLATGSPGLARR
jgi:hypothetical protein